MPAGAAAPACDGLVRRCTRNLQSRCMLAACRTGPHLGACYMLQNRVTPQLPGVHVRCMTAIHLLPVIPACRKVRSSASVNAQAPTPAGRQILSSPSVGTQHPPTLHVTECTRPAPCADPPHTLRATPRTCTACTRPRCARPRCFPARSGACPTAQARYGRPRRRARRRLPRLRIHSYSGARCVLRAAVRPSPRPQNNRC